MTNTFLYPRVVAITRPVGPSGKGYVGYSGAEASEETPVASGVPASIQVDRSSSRQRSDDLPAAPPSPVVWKIYIPAFANIAKGAIEDRDVATDDNGDRYQIEAAYWHPMGWTLSAIRLEAH